MIQQINLRLGATLVAESVENTRTAALGFWYNHGSRDESPVEYGCSHFLEHMVFKGTETRSAAQIARDIDSVGGAINAFTDREMTCFYCNVPGDAAPVAAEVLADLSTAAMFDSEDLEKERQVVLNEIFASDDSPDECAFQVFLERLWGKHPLSRSIAGRPHQVERIDHDSLEHFYRRRLNPSCLTVSAAGNMNIEKVAAVIDKALQRSADQWVSGEPSTTDLRIEPVGHDGIWQVPHPCQQVYLYGGRVMPLAHTTRNFYALSLLSTIVGESMSSRLFQCLREERGLCYSIGSFRMHLSDNWLWSVFANYMPEDREKLLNALFAELQSLRNQSPSRKEIDEAVSHLRGGLIFAREDMDSRMRRLVYQKQTFGRVLTFEEMDDCLIDINGDDLERLSSIVADTDAFALVAYGGDGSGIRAKTVQ